VLDPRARRRQKVRNAAQSTLLLGCLLAVAAGVGWLLLGAFGLLWLTALAAVVLLLRPRIPARVVLRVFRAEPLPREVAPELHWIVDRLAERAGLRHRPAVSYLPSPVPNCFCVGSGGGAVLAVSDGLLRLMPRRELTGVLAHEVGHLHGGDAAVMMLTDTISRLAQGLALVALLFLPVALVGAAQEDVGPLLVCGVLIALPVVVTLLQLALSRAREFDADLAAARLTGDPEGLARALELLEAATGRIWERILVPRARVPDPLLLRTHPSTEERTRRLRALEPDVGERWYVAGPAAPPAGYPQVIVRPPLRLPGTRW
jgi:heat shock protein HtpX